MKIILVALGVVLSLALVTSCSKDETTSPNDDNNQPFGTVSGVVEDTFGQGIQGAGIAASGRTTQTNEQGWFYLSGLSTGDVMVGISAPGYLTTYRGARIIQNQTSHLGTVALLETETTTIAAESGGQVATGDGDGMVEFQGGSFVGTGGQPYSGEVTVEISAMLPTEDAFFNAFPGDFQGIREDGSTIQFQSYGFMGVNMYSSAGSRLQLGTGREAEMQLRIPDEISGTAPDSLPMWYFDETTGVWREEGMAVREGTHYRAAVAHLSIWNWDYPIEDICSIEGRVVDDAGQPIADGRVISQGVDVTYLDEGFTDTAGNFSVRALKNSTVQLRAIKGSYASEPVTVTVGQECPVQLSEPLVLREPAFSIALRWGEDPSDLDSHLFIPMTWDQNWDLYHIAYYNPGTLAEDPYTALDTDDVTSFGPEIISGFGLYQGTYSYFVHLYSGSGTIKQSPAIVDVEIAGQHVTYDASNAAGTVGEHWHVFDFAVAANGNVTLTGVNRFETWNFGDARVYPGLGRAPHGGEGPPRK